MYYTLCIKLTTERLNAMISLLDKVAKQAEEKGMTEEELIALRLVPDMFPLVKQVQIASDNAKGMASRLGGKENPKMDDTETTIEALKERLTATIEYLATFQEEDFEGAEAREARFPYFPGMYMKGPDYLLGYGIPNFFFHIVTVYDILRHYGFDIGKADYMGSIPLVPEAS